MTRAYIGIGSNIDPERNMREAVKLLAAEVALLDLSTVYLTQPFGRPDQPSYYNCVAAIETELPPRDLKQKVLRGIESRLGRTRSSDAYAPRTIDLDLILYGEMVLHENELELPDPDIVSRSFLAAGLLELAPGLELPGSKRTISEIANRLKDPAMRPLASYTALLKGELRNGQ